MRAGIFQFMNDAVVLINKHSKFINFVAEESKDFFRKIFETHEDVININARVKKEDSIKEKILKQNYYMKCESVDEVLTLFPDLVGVRIECRFNENEKDLYDYLKRLFYYRDDDGYYFSKYDMRIRLNLEQPQPQMQKNGFEIYKIDAIFVESEKIKINFEVQIKSMVNVFWGEVDHSILYKNSNYVMTEDLIRDVMYSIKNNLTIIDKQLNSVYKKMMKVESNEDDAIRQQFKSIITKMIHDGYLLKLKYNLGFVIDMRNIANVVSDYLFSVMDMLEKNQYEERLIEILNKANSISNKPINFGVKYDFSNLDYGDYIHTAFAKGLDSRLNKDFNWNFCLSIMFALDEREDYEIFMDFVYYVIYSIRKVIENEISNCNINKTYQDILVDKLLKKSIEYLSESYNINNFSQNSFDIIGEIVKDFVKDVESVEDIEKLDFLELNNKFLEKFEGIINEN